MRSMSQCFNIVYLAGGLAHALNDVLHAAERERLSDSLLSLPKRMGQVAPGYAMLMSLPWA
jgi:hypothetical protein